MPPFLPRGLPIHVHVLLLSFAVFFYFFLNPLTNIFPGSSLTTPSFTDIPNGKTPEPKNLQGKPIFKADTIKIEVGNVASSSKTIGNHALVPTKSTTTNQNPTTTTIPTIMSTHSQDKAAKRARFEAAWTEIRDEVLEYFKGEHMPLEAVEWYKANLDYNVPGGKLNRGMSVCDTASILKGRTLTNEEYKRTAVLGWCIELLQAFFLVSDDMMDASITRRGQPCWYRQPKVGMLAINDSFMLEAPIYWLLRKYFRHTPYYADLVDLFHETTFQTEMGQLVDLITAPETAVDLTKFSLERHRLIVVYKTAYYSFYLPVACAMIVEGIPYPVDQAQVQKKGLGGPRFDFVGGGFGGVNTPANTDPYNLALSILIPLGEYFQVQDDYLDYSATPKVLGKIGTDIVDNKCSWVVNTVLVLLSRFDGAADSASASASASAAATAPFTASPLGPSVLPEPRKAELLKVLHENYGRKDAESEQRVKGVYEEVGVGAWYKRYEEGVVGELRRRIEAVDEERSGLRREVFTSFLEKIYGRSK